MPRSFASASPDLLNRRERRTLRRERLRARRRITGNQWLSMCLASVTVVALAAYALVTAIRCGFVKWSDIKHALKFCETFDCCKIADEMVTAMDLGGDPCDDFYRYACGKATNSSLISAHRDKTGYSIVLEKVRNLLATWALQEEDRTPLQKSAALYQECLAVTKDTMRNANQLVAFLRSRRIDLAQLDSDTDPLDVVLDLEVRHNIKTIINIGVERRLILIKHRGALNNWRKVRRALIKNRTYTDYLKNSFSVMGVASDTRIRMLTVSVRKTEVTVLRLMSNVSRENAKGSPGYVFLCNCTEPTVLMRPQWRNYLRKFWYQVAFKAHNVASYLDQLFKEITPKAMIQYIYWEVIRQLGPFADFRLRAPDEVLQETTDRCFRAVLSVSGLPALAAVLAENVTSEGIVSTASFLTRLLERTGVNVTVSIVHPQQLFAVFHARQKPEVAKRVDRPFLKAYLTALRELSQNNFDSIDALETTNPAVEDLLGHRVVYDGERLLVPTSLLAAFWFLPTTTRSFTYAGLGYEVLLELFRTGAINLTSKVYCKSSANPNVDLRCLDALWELFENDDGQWSRLRLPAGVNKLSEEQLLFLVLCQKKCSTRDAEECNFPLRTWPQFAKAFQCQRGDHMSPKEDERCSVNLGSRILKDK